MAPKVSPKPQGYHTVTPSIVVQEGAKALESVSLWLPRCRDVRWDPGVPIAPWPVGSPYCAVAGSCW